MTFDVLVLGAGLAGCKTALELASHNIKTALITSGRLGGGSSFFHCKQSLGTCVNNGPKDRQYFLEEILEMGRGLSYPLQNKILVDEIENEVQQGYRLLGFEPYRSFRRGETDTEEGLVLGCFARRPRQNWRISGWDNARRHLSLLLQAQPLISIFENTRAFEIVKTGNNVCGLFAADVNGQKRSFGCKAIVLCTGGVTGLYKHCLNPREVDGSGHALALRAGAKLVNMEFLQILPVYTHAAQPVPVSEASLFFCNALLDNYSNNLLPLYTPLEFQRLMRLRSEHGPFTSSMDSKSFDLAIMAHIRNTQNEKSVNVRFNQSMFSSALQKPYLSWLRNNYNIDLKESANIAPFAHACNGGIVVGTSGQTEVNGLYAVGEAAGINGANRLGGVATAACLVFSKRCAQHIFETLPPKNALPPPLPQKPAVAESTKGLPALEVLARISEILFFNANVLRNGASLQKALQDITLLEDNFTFNAFVSGRQYIDALRAKDALLVAKALLSTMLNRTESRGAHYREDFPTENPLFKKRQLIKYTNGNLQISFEK